MNPNNPPQTPKTRKALLILMKIIAPPLVLYVDNPEEAYAEIKTIIELADQRAPKLIERIGKGPLKQLAIMDTQIAGVALQEEPA